MATPSEQDAPEARTIDWATGKRLYEHDGYSYREIADRLGCTHEAVRKACAREGWEREVSAAAARDAVRSEAAKAGGAEMKSRWAQRRAAEADAAGITAAIARQRVVAAMEANNHLMTRSAVIAYAILIDKAQLLSGGATARITNGDEVHEHAEKLLSELDVRRERNAA